ncbi:hypothetical protein KCH_08990 [Kitasatospora cheerisanensis KCTC 2395]|uniref:Uncharacterized protein n=1 Tax=Kitasatospora cheerisanensis KCTC 2395 TaxID=1348663 RepID=A0A066Z0L7_9ACTN|nr:hypothetical protein KCH_08990 [Kitasatospora cheerisanensis KCTC 2395]
MPIENSRAISCERPVTGAPESRLRGWSVEQDGGRLLRRGDVLGLRRGDRGALGTPGGRTVQG